MLIPLILLILLPVLFALGWWGYSCDRLWMHALFAPALAMAFVAEGIALFYWSVGSGGYAIVMIPIAGATLLSFVGYYAAVIIKRIRGAAQG